MAAQGITKNTVFRLTSLPAELTQMVAQHLPRKDLLSFRQVSRELCHCAQRAFVDTVYSHLSILLADENSLRQAVEVAQHPIYGKAVREITFFLDEVNTDGWTFRDQRTRVSTYRMLRIENESAKERYLNNDVRVSLLTRNPVIWTHRAWELLDTLFASVKARGKLQHVYFRDLQSYDRKETPRPSISSTLRKHYRAPAPHESQGASFMVIEAIAKAEISLTSLDMYLFAGAINIDWLPPTVKGPCEISELKQVLSSVTSLRLQTCLLADEGDTPDLKPFCELLAACSALKQLTLLNRWDGEHGDAYYDLYDRGELECSSIFTALHRQTFPGLQHLTVTGMKIEKQQMKHFIQQNPTITYLKFDHIVEEWDEKRDEYVAELQTPNTNVQEVKVREKLHLPAE